MNNTLTILPTSRAIREKVLGIEGATLFLPNYMTMSEFVSKLCIVKDFKLLDEDARVLLLLEACDFREFKKLGIERNFFTFTKNSSYIFNLFEELSAELYDINDIYMYDIYAEYEEHIVILGEVYRRYELLCRQRGALDRIFLPKLYRFNEEFAKKYKTIELHVEGHLTNFELELVSKCAECCEVEIIFNATRFNAKIRNLFSSLGMKSQTGYEHRYLFNTGELLHTKPIKPNTNVTCISFSEPILQAAFVKQKIYEFVKKGYEPHRIAVILPDESFADVLRAFDTKGNLNFAMGENFSKSILYRKLEASCAFIEQDSKENASRLERLGGEVYMRLRDIYFNQASKSDIFEILQGYKEENTEDKREAAIFEEELHCLGRLPDFAREISVKALLKIFLQRLRSRSIDDIRGGKITVMGVLETRAVEFDAVIIVDFTDSNVPKRSNKDMFLNSAVREAAALPTMSDRENLQKHYYEMLLNRSKEAVLSFVKSERDGASRFLKQTGIKERECDEEIAYGSILFKNSPQEALLKPSDNIELEYSFKDKKISATKLKTFLTCKRKYYYAYVKRIEEHEIPQDMPKEYEIGRDIHKALKELYTKKSGFDSLEELKRALDTELDKVCGKSELEKYQIALYKKSMLAFCEREIERFGDGWSVYRCEESVLREFEGMMIEGIIDRVDKRGDEVFVLDYKTGSYPLYNEKNVNDAVDFQLEFYYLLAQKHGRLVGCAYYDLRDFKVVEEPLLEQKLSLLALHVRELKSIERVDFSKCEDVKKCVFCEYKTVCGRE